MSKCPNYGRGRGGSEPSLNVQTFCVHTCLMGGGGSGVLDNVQNLVVFFFFLWLPLACLEVAERFVVALGGGFQVQLCLTSTLVTLTYFELS